LRENINQENERGVLEQGRPLYLLELQNFRNISSCQWFPHPRFNFFFGQNAQGKTSFLEAIYFLSELKSFRTQENASLIQHGQENSLLRAELKLHSITQDLAVMILAATKNVHLNGKKPRPYSKLRQILPIVLFTPDSTRLFRTSPGERRAYFDRILSLLSEDYTLGLEDYHKVLKQKQELLDQAEERLCISPQLEVWNEKMAILGSKLIFLRFRFTEKIAQKFGFYFPSLSGALWKSLFYYEPYLASIRQDMNSAEIEKLLLEEIKKRNNEERERKQVLVGPHRDDWGILLEGQKLKEEASQGQHRLSMAALKLSEVALIREMGKTPLALFDDLLSELDAFRCRLILQVLSECACQVFLTSVTPLGVPLEGLDGLSYEVKKGELLTPSPIN